MFTVLSDLDPGVLDVELHLDIYLNYTYIGDRFM